MRIVPVPIVQLAEQIGRAFSIGGLTVRQVADVGHFMESLTAQGAVLTKHAYLPNASVKPEVETFAAGTDERFWSNTSFILYSQVSGQPGPFEDKALQVEGPTTPDELVRYYKANIWGKLFDIDVVMLGRDTRQLLVVTHYGAVALFAPPGSAPAPS